MVYLKLKTITLQLSGNRFHIQKKASTKIVNACFEVSIFSLNYLYPKHSDIGFSYAHYALRILLILLNFDQNIKLYQLYVMVKQILENIPYHLYESEHFYTLQILSLIHIYCREFCLTENLSNE